MEKPVNVKSPTGCIHRARISRFSVKGSYKTLCNHTTPSPGGLGWHNNGYHPWPETDEEVTCKRCLKEIEPKVTARRHDIKWLKSDTIKKEVSAEVTVNEWHDFRGAVLTVPAVQKKFILYSGKYYTGMRGIGSGSVPKMSEERRQWLHLVAQTYWSAVFAREMNYTWAPLD